MIPEGIGRYQGPARRILQPIVRRLWDFDIQGLDNVPEVGPAVLCPNHAAFIDSLFVPAVLNRNLTYVGKAEYLDDWKTKRLFPALGMIPIDRRGGDHAKAALDTARAVLESGGLFGIYPEGTRSRSGKLHKGHTGAARLAVETGAPLIPVGLIGTAEIQPPDAFMPKCFRKVTIRFGRPIEVDRYRDRVGDRNVYRELTDEVMFEIQQLTGLEYVHEYATSSKSEGDPQPELVGADVSGPDAADPAPNGAAEQLLVERPASDTVLEQRPLRPLDEILAGSANG
ncbi:MAG: 1-acyl-sn-glycerol-3-phosphate acyltransferase [Acidimicrobiia bacterium]|nr:1-acyl-sn-glycerol-3-phosphate acyltransferase [Acidimicrobiia bacterium]